MPDVRRRPTSDWQCPSCGEDPAATGGNRRAHIPILPPIETVILFPILVVAVLIALVLPLVAWLRHLLTGP
jgi:hypothetical protein